MTVTSYSASTILLLLAAGSTAIDFCVEGTLDAIDKVSVVPRSTILDINDGRWLLLNLLCELSLCHVCLSSGILDRLGAHVRHRLELDLLIVIDAEVVVGNLAGMVVDLFLLEGSSGRRQILVAASGWPTVLLFLLDSAGNEHILALLATEGGRAARLHLLLRLGLLDWLLDCFPISVHLYFEISCTF